MPSLGSIPPGKGAKKRVLRRYLKVKATKPEERGGRESERSTQLSKKGYNVFVLQYRVGGELMACEDLAAAISFIFRETI